MIAKSENDIRERIINLVGNVGILTKSQIKKENKDVKATMKMVK